jgi:glycosyltransferase involved in cell wall biosynthesis
MNVLCTYSNSYGGGTESVLLNGLPFLSRTPGVHITFADLYSRPSVSRKFEEAGLTTWRNGDKDRPSIVSFRSGWHRKFDVATAIPRHSAIVADLRSAIREADVLYVHSYKDLVLCGAARIASLRRPPPVVLHCHGLDDRFVPPMLAALANRCARIITISDDTKNHLTAIGVRPSLVHTVHNAVNHRRIAEAALRPPTMPLPPTDGRRVILVCPSAIRSLKGVHLAIEALRHLPLNVDLWVTGDQTDRAASDYLKTLLSLAEREGVTERVHFVGLRSDLPAVMKLVDLVCIPSLWREGFPLVAVEAMALGKPVVASCRGGLPEAIKDRTSGIIFDPDRPGDLARALSEVITDASLAASLVAAAKRSVLEHFTYDRWAKQVTALLSAAASRDVPGELTGCTGRR